MRRIHAGVTTTAVAAAILSAVLVARTGEASVPVAAESGDVSVTQFTLHASGRKGECVVTPDVSATESRKSLDVTPGCAAVHAQLMNATQWFERDDGSVAFLDSGGRAVVEFSVSDGAAYESYSPAQPMMVMMVDG